MSSNNVQLKFKLDKKTRTDSYGSFTLEPLERGAGITVGNAMRRVLLTSIPGVAVNALKIDGVLHEYATLKGVKEDVSDLIQNLKQVRFKLTDPKPDKIQLSFNGKGVFTAKDIDKASDQYAVSYTHLTLPTILRV